MYSVCYMCTQSATCVLSLLHVYSVCYVCTQSATCVLSLLHVYSVCYMCTHGLLHQAAESIQAEDESAKLCKRRIEHLKEHSSDQLASVSLWKKKRMDRMMVEHLLRCGYYNTAVKLARQSGIEVLLYYYYY